MASKNVEYKLVDGYYLPVLKMPRAAENIGWYGMKRYSYLREYKPREYDRLLLTDKIADHLEETDRAAEEMAYTLTEQLAKQQGATEKLKAEDMMAWVGIMNNIQQQVREIVLNELIYV